MSQASLLVTEGDEATPARLQITAVVVLPLFCEQRLSTDNLKSGLRD